MNLKKEIQNYEIPPKDDITEGYIFFDIESMIGANNSHVPNFIVASKSCNNCLNKEFFTQDCKSKFEFEDANTFGQWIVIAII